ncbi:hypothetical protein GCM10027188_25320 [Lysobacter humi (ex Lee et al. 2017)]
MRVYEVRTAATTAGEQSADLQLPLAPLTSERTLKFRPACAGDEDQPFIGTSAIHPAILDSAVSPPEPSARPKASALGRLADLPTAGQEKV